MSETEPIGESAHDLDPNQVTRRQEKEETTLRRTYAALIILGLMLSPPVFAGGSAPAEAPEQSAAAQSVQPQMDKLATDKAAEKRKEINYEATVALNESGNALKALDEDKADEALAALEKATGKVELILARDPELALAPVEVQVVTNDLLASLDTAKAMIEEAEDYLEDGEIQKARRLVAGLASEIQLRITNIPLATYPEAIKAVTPLIDERKLDEARAALQAALNTLVVTTDIIPLPKLRGELLLKNAEALSEKEERTVEDNATLANLLAEARNQLKMAQLLGYGTKEAYKPMYEQLDQIRAKAVGGKGGKGWFDAIKQQLSELL